MPRKKAQGKAKALGVRKPRNLTLPEDLPPVATGPNLPSSQQSSQADRPSSVMDTVEDDDDDENEGEGSAWFAPDDDVTWLSQSEDEWSDEDTDTDETDPDREELEKNTELRVVADTLNATNALDAAQYEDRENEPDDPQPIDFDTEIRGAEDQPSDDVHMSDAPVPEPRTKHVFDPSDPSTLIPHMQNMSLDLSLFELGIGAFIDLTGTSRTDYSALREVLHTLKDENGNVLAEVARLPKHMSTLINRLRSRLPLRDMRSAPIALKVEKLPTKAANEKVLVEADEVTGASSKGKGNADAVPKKKYETVESTLHFMDPTSVFVSQLSSEIAQDMHRGPGLIVDEESEMFHSHRWKSSLRASDGIYPHFNSGAVIFPSDFIYYRCEQAECQCNQGDEVEDLHVGRVVGFGYDHRDDAITADKTKIVLEVQEGFFNDSAHMPNNLKQRGKARPSDWDDEEILLTSKVSYVQESAAVGAIINDDQNIYIDRVFGETQDDPQPSESFINSVLAANKKNQKREEDWEKANEAALDAGDSPPKKPKRVKVPKAFPKYYKATVAAGTERNANTAFVVRRRLEDGTDSLIPMCHIHPLCAELEIEVYGRALYEERWDMKQPDAIPTISFPQLTFIDGVGAYRNSYRTLMAVYTTPAGLPEESRLREAAIEPLALGPHGSNFEEVVGAMRSMRYLDEGILQTINGKEYRVCAFTMCYTGDMPQQAQNAGLKGPRGHKFCRFCFIGAQNKANAETPSAVLDFDISKHGRYHYQLKDMQRMMDELPTDADRARYSSQWGIANTNPPLLGISPALDLIMSFPSDGAHSEYKGITNLGHFMLRDGIMLPHARLEYATTLRSWPFPPGAQRLQSPVHHLGSYSLSDHANWSRIIPALLRETLEESQMQPRFIDACKEAGEDPVSFVVSTFAAIAKSNSVLMGRRVSREDKGNIKDIGEYARIRFNRLNIMAYESISPAGAGGAEGISRAGSIEGGELVMDSITVGISDDTKQQKLSKRAKQYLADMVRPNAHVVVHYPELAHQFGLLRNVDSLEGEGFHKVIRDRVYETNFKNIEKILLKKINVSKTIRLVLRGGAAYDVELTRNMKELYACAPSLFSKVLSVIDRARIDTDTEIADTDFELDVDQSSNETHEQCTVINQIEQKDVLAMTHAANEGQPLPTRAGKITPSFRRLIRTAFEDNYAFRSGEPVVLGNAPIQWCRKFSFFDGTAKFPTRYVFKAGDFVEYKSPHHEAHQKGRVDHIFVFDCLGIYRHIFVILTRIEPANRRDELLDLEVWNKTDEPVIVGLTAIQPVKPYMVPVTGVGIVHVTWDPYYM